MVYLAMNSKHTSSLVLADFLKRNIIVDFYSSRLKIESEDAKIGAKQHTKSALKKFKNIDSKKLKLATNLISLTKNELSDFYKWADTKKPKNQNQFVLPLVINSVSKKYFNIFERNTEKKSFNICWWGSASKLHGFEYLLSELNIIFSETKIQNFFI